MYGDGGEVGWGEWGEVMVSNSTVNKFNSSLEFLISEKIIECILIDAHSDKWFQLDCNVNVTYVDSTENSQVILEFVNDYLAGEFRIVQRGEYQIKMLWIPDQTCIFERAGIALSINDVNDILVEVFGVIYSVIHSTELVTDRTRESDAQRFLCMDCQMDTNQAQQYYMLKMSVWYRINQEIDGMLCIECVEKRLGRKLVASDFTNAPVNASQAEFCKILADRLVDAKS